MLCRFCSDIDLDQLVSEEGYKHHASCADLLQSAEDGCDSCKLIWDSRWTEYGGSLSKERLDLGPLETQIIARAVDQKLGGYYKIRYGQEKRRNDHELRLMTGHWPLRSDNASLDNPFLWGFLSITSQLGDVSTKYVKYRPLNQRTRTSWLPLASGWLKNCLANHEACAHNSSTISPPTRVLDLGPSNGEADPFLYVPAVGVQEWVTLSHCWGQHQPLQTTSANLTQHQQALPIHELPPLFQDAIEITKSLGFRYLWIDSLCIVQDSKEDWLKELSNMGNIYRSSVFTICADNCRNHTERILHNHHPIETEYTQQGCRSSKEGFKSVIYALGDELQEGRRSRGYLRHRAWALQEQILSPRTLQWTLLELVWTCRCMSCSEESPIDQRAREIVVDIAIYGQTTKSICLSTDQLQASGKEQQNKPDPVWGDPTQTWYHLVKQYCIRNLTFVQDTLPAISGIAKEVQRQNGFEYRAGIWAQDMHNGLLWTATGRVSNPLTYTAPSWSWASVGMGKDIRPACIGPSRMKFSGSQSVLRPVATILGVDIVCNGSDDFGPIESGILHINAPYQSLRLFRDYQIRLPLFKDKIPNYSEDPGSYRIQRSTVTCWLDARGKGETTEDEFILTYLALRVRGAVIAQLAFIDSSYDTTIISSRNNYYQERFKSSLRDQNWALILEPASGNESHNGKWKRIGVARIADDLKDGWDVQDFNII